MSREKLFSPLPWLTVGLVLSLVLARPWLEWRMRQARKRREALKEKSERSARESHDVLLQELQGLVLRFEAVARRIPAHDPLRVMMDTVLERADQVVLDGRDRVRAMQAATEQSLELSKALATFANDFVTDDPPTFCLVVEGKERSLEGRVHACVYAIGKEAIRNAFRHARASHVEVEINHGLDRFRLRVRDDGIGIDARIVGGAECPKHRGLTVMRERTLQVGAELAIWGRDGLGTEVEFQVHSAIAYETGRKTFLGKLRRLMGGGRYK
ncbi:sensor histidine kinase [Rhodanobacter spathiphylli]|uniref:sensor histidine kinase n=1 Tax=Rhodanobacter spathiphylli TaxID=347483 RepID=UPI00138998D0|nr:ATP-binding protein [Rhodanobacter spathiphylli]